MANQRRTRIFAVEDLTDSAETLSSFVVAFLGCLCKRRYKGNSIIQELQILFRELTFIIYMNEFQRRLQSFIAYKDKSVLSFENQCGIAPGTVSKMTARSRLKTLEKISKANPDLNMDWLRTGEGSMLNAAPQERYEVGFGIGKQQGGRNDFKIEIKEEDARSAEKLEQTICDLQKEVDYLRELLAEKDARIAEKDERIAELKERITELKEGK